MRKLSSLFLISLLSGTTTLGGYKLFFENTSTASSLSIAPNYTRAVSMGAENIDFTSAAEKAVHTVVHVKNKTVYNLPSDPFMEFFYGHRGGQQQTQVGTGSGVIISKDGYIVTNNHVIQNATELEVTLNNNKTYKAKLVGTDSKMDIALLKIEAEGDLPTAIFGNSEQIKVGEWVLAVGNPYNLTSTVTAGIVSAKARDLSNQGIQSFIQTDAAVNPGNSGGALVNTRGELIGINTMISSPTGSYTGYSFAVPSNLARKIVEDLMEYGNVQRAVLGIEGRELNTTAAKEVGSKETTGVYVAKVSKGTGAEKAGIKSGDIIKKLDDKTINTFADLTAYINTKRPNEEVKVGFVRDGNLQTTVVKLVKKELINYDLKGLELEDLDAHDKKRFRLSYGVKIKEVTNEELTDYAEQLKGGIILKVDNIKATDIETVTRVIAKKGETQKTQIEMLTNTGELLRFLL
ncbi:MULTISPECIES: S1C family serine protease [Flavobacterium]|uniref:PDZ domain-containing protein n=2 Tax=Flavobacterium TaxID=237 RepID=A0AA94F2C9_9FLAO|nr:MULTISPECIES: trypsin-like peptidase domain-containing protein [Flavobacterium]OXA83286.1 serine protease [Flavobacterium columnare] [Flavobacterium columnare NBRC 100251 = ATCC 23463]AMA49595.1 serine protease [Flavobacterium covae]AND63292.1 serine protease [Flavobacterium covae]MCH4828881.1 trypsin-like peptidase domain-containing protein [Flavobacterium columnare]MCH4832135.1 trypsin-like peptidase domain-containing protein [Flavobacterium columnare]